MPDRSTEQVRTEIAAERGELAGEIGALRQVVACVLRYAIGEAMFLAVLSGSNTARFAIIILWWVL